MNSPVSQNNKKIRIILAALLILIPAILIFSAFRRADTGAFAASRVSSVRVDAPDGTSAVFEEQDDFRFYTELLAGLSLIDENFRDVSAETPFTVTFSNTDTTSDTYRFYPSVKTSDCIVVDAAGAYYMIDGQASEKLFARPEFTSANAYAIVPRAVVSFDDGTETLLVAGEGEWHYQANDGFEQKTLTTADNPTVRINISSAGNLSFDSALPPENVSVRLQKDGVTVYEGAYETMLTPVIMSANDTYYDLSVFAEWAQTDDAASYGSVVYHAKLLYDVAPTFELIRNGVLRIGDFTVLKAYNFNDGDHLYAECGYPVQPELYLFDHPDGKSKMAFVTAAYSVGTTGTYSLKAITGDGRTQTMTVNVRQGKTPAVATQQMLIDDIDLQGAFTEEAFAEFNTLIAEKTAQSDNAVYWTGRFAYPNAAGKASTDSSLAGYGTYRTVRGLHTASYYHPGLDMTASQGDAVYASNQGKVVFVGDLALTGHTVVIDHGCSVLTVYGNLADSAVNEGDLVAGGTVIGSAGTTGFAAALDGAAGRKKAQIHFAVYMGGAAVNPTYVADEDICFD